MTFRDPRKSKVLGKGRGGSGDEGRGSRERGQSLSVSRHLFLYFYNMHRANWTFKHQDSADVASPYFPPGSWPLRPRQWCHQAGAITQPGSMLGACSPQLLQNYPALTTVQ